MQEERFVYASSVLSSCASSELAAFIAGNGDLDTHHWRRASSAGSDEACFLLHQQHALHYNRSIPGKFRNGDLEVGGRLRRFVQTVLLVHKHNSLRQQLHRLTINKFADEEPPFSLNEGRAERDLSFLDWGSIDKEWVLSPFGDDDVEIAANLTIGHGGMDTLHYHSKKKKKLRVKEEISDKLKFPTSGRDPYFAVPLLDDPDLDGELLRVKPRKSILRRLESGEFEKTDQFGAFLNWATHDNPDGVPMVKESFDQGECGSCWAFAAAGSLEASVSRRQAHDAFNEYLESASSRRREERHIDLLREEAAEFAKSVEEAAFEMANLSIQELIDCDTATDQGCIGGNPLLAFYFIHRYGLTSWSQYPYLGHEDTCQKKWVNRPVAKVKSWGIIAPNHEHHMELAIRFIGPIAVGVNAADRSFLAYSDGIFVHPNCRQGANHALLIVGYGQEENYMGEVVKYWIARNTWGREWGEDGYIRIMRGDGLKGTQGTCGVARSPSVALGGVLLANRHKLAPYHRPTSSQRDAAPLSTSAPKGFCARLGFESCHGMLVSFGHHKALVLGFTGIFCAVFLAVWPHSFQCRRRSQRRRRMVEVRKSLRLAEGAPPLLEAPPRAANDHPTEIDPLLGDRRVSRYGG